MKTFALKFLAASLLISFSACSDDDKDAPAVPDLKPQVQVKEITRGNSIYNSFNYDTDGRNASFAFDSDPVLTFSYSPFTIGGYFRIDKPVVNNKGHITSMNVNDDGESGTLKASYDGKGYLTQLDLSIGGRTNTRKAVWKDGLLMSVSASGSSYMEGIVQDYVFEYSGKTPVYNKKSQWSTVLAQAIGENDLCMPLAFCGFLGYAPKQLPQKVTLIEKDENGEEVDRMPLNFDFLLNPDGSIALEAADGTILNYSYF